MLASNLSEESGACVVSYQDMFSNKFQVILDQNNCIEFNNIYYCISLIVKEDKVNAVIGYLKRIK